MERAPLREAAGGEAVWAVTGQVRVPAVTVFAPSVGTRLPTSQAHHAIT